MYRQGDVLLKRVAGVPAEAKKIARVGGRVILAAGEVTGHHHAIRDSGVALVEHEGRRFVTVGEKGAELKHEEHTAIPLAPGAYEVIQQREYDDAEEWTRVRD